ncbi:hypothetical protein BC937DRAFT_94345 [Endogone sp. FLAS-F59071]|nr:hypothetical protein BC937DRAFT_94345 [Endogone sp. FLAS-F59071]|eukprot:RUS20808.1 hypothetical protein BC937DRAFT_94345 [Endogone sp. FLAS-F59071]
MHLVSHIFHPLATLLFAILLFILAAPATARWFGKPDQSPQQPAEQHIPNDYEKDHMLKHHNIQVFDEISFFKLHDLDHDNYLDESELRSLYGFERDVDPQASHIKAIIGRVLEDMDTDKDGRISMSEYIRKQLPELSSKEREQDDEWIKKSIVEGRVEREQQRREQQGQRQQAMMAEAASKKVEGVPNKYRV